MILACGVFERFDDTRCQCIIMSRIWICFSNEECERTNQYVETLCSPNEDFGRPNANAVVNEASHCFLRVCQQYSRLVITNIVANKKVELYGPQTKILDG